MRSTATSATHELARKEVNVQPGGRAVLVTATIICMAFGVLSCLGIHAAEHTCELARGDSWRWIRKAADMGDVDAQAQLGHLLSLRTDVNAYAYMYYSLAAMRGDSLSAKLRDELAGKMTPEDIALGRQLLRDWKPAAR